MESKEYSWRYITASELLSHGPCELLYIYHVPGSTATYCRAYDGVDATGTEIVRVLHASATSHPFNPKVPVYCRKGLYVSLSANVVGVFVQWRELGLKEG